MFERTVSQDELTRFKQEREEADRQYNAALAALDAVIHSLTEYPHPPPALDEFQITPLNTLWKVIDQEPAPGGWRGRFRRAVWAIVGPILQRQQEFNAALVDHVNRNVTHHREVQRALASAIALFRDHLTSYELHVMTLLQRLTPYLDTKDREVASLMRRINEDVGEQVGLLWHRYDDLNTRLDDAVHTRLPIVTATINGVGDEMLKRWESSAARDERQDAAAAALAARVASIQDTLALVRTATQALKRRFEDLGTIDAAEATAPRPAAQTAAPVPAGPPDDMGLSEVDSYKYLAFENQFRGPEDEIRQRVADYLAYFEGASDVLDVGCGRGEFLEVLRDAGIKARGVDVNREMVEVCRARGLDVVHGDALTFLAALPDESLGGLFAAQVVEHLQPAYLVRLLDTAFHKLRPGSRIVLETINPSCWIAFFESYIRDITHVKPVHADTLKYLLTASGFQPVELRFSAPYPEHAKLRTVRPNGDAGAQGGLQRAMAEVVNENAEKVNRLLFGYMDYAAIGRR